MFFSPFIIPVVAIIAFAAIAISRGPLGRAIAQRIASGGGEASADTEALRAEIHALAQRLADMEERMDFTERVLQQERAREKLGSGDA